MYEKAIQSPIKNAIFGDLIQLILIQVQKSIVDIESAMLALDKLLKSNGSTINSLEISLIIL
jgi:nuclear-control-of-ATPase protein 2